MELSCKRDAHFDKITFFVPGTFFDANWTPKGSQNRIKRPFKIDEKSDAFFDRKNGRVLVKGGAQREPMTDPESSRADSESSRADRDFSRTDPESSRTDPESSRTDPESSRAWFQLAWI